MDLTFNSIIIVESSTFRDMYPNTVHSCNLKICCIYGFWENCKANKDTFSSCDDLLSNRFIKYLFFLIGSISVFLNIISFFLNIRKTKMTQNILSAYLALIDRYFGIYLLIIAKADMYYKGNYIGLEMSWRSSLTCKLASFFSLVSLTVSPVILCIIMVSRFCVIQWPMTSKFIEKSFVNRVMEMSLIPALCSCIILISTIFSFLGKNGLTGICLPLYTYNAHSLPLLFSTLIIVTVQMLCLVIIITLSILTLNALKKAESCTTHNRHKNIIRYQNIYL